MQEQENNNQLTINLSFNIDAINLILEGLAELPLKRSADLYMSIKAEADKQIQLSTIKQQTPDPQKEDIKKDK